jgi:hypothetical protein
MTASKLAREWDSLIAHRRAESIRNRDFADLLATVDPRWHGAVETSIWGGGNLGLHPVDRALARTGGLTVRRSKSGFSMQVARRRPSLGASVVRRARATVPDAPAALETMLAALFVDQEVAPSATATSAWAVMVDDLRADAAETAGKVRLLEAVPSELRERCQAHDNGHDFKIVRAGDSDGDDEGIWITGAGDGWSFTHRVHWQQASGSRIVGEFTASTENAAGILNRLLEEIVSRMPPPELSAQDAYRALLRDHVAPALRLDGYAGSSGHFHRTVGEHEVLIRFRKAEFSTRARVDYTVDIDVMHLATAELFRRSHEEARALGRRHAGPTGWRSIGQLPQWSSGGAWAGLRPDDDLAEHAAGLLADIRSLTTPAIDQLG